MLAVIIILSVALAFMVSHDYKEHDLDVLRNKNKKERNPND